MSKKMSLFGHKYNHWSVVGAASSAQKGNAMWLCRCDCGREAKVAAANLRSGKSKSCVHCGNSHSPGVAALNKLYMDYSYGARRRGISWELTKDQFKKITSSPCYYTGRRPSSVQKALGGDYVYNGVDRLDSTKGYTVDNCVPCIGRVNVMKWDSSYEDFIDLCRQVVAHFEEKNRG
jgi:hypothetical protein